MTVILSETAAREIVSIVKTQNLELENVRLRVGVKGGGCSGFSYLLDLTETQKETDEEWTFEFPTVPSGNGGGNGDTDGEGGTATAVDGDTFTVRVICDPKSYLYLNGTTIDFKDELMGRGFVFENPNASSTCGCGSSFSA